MNWPTSQDYNEAVQDPAMSFADPALTGGEVVVNALGLPVPRSGNFADVYQFKGADGKTWALKCFTRKVAGLKERYARIDEHLNKARLPFTVGFKFLQEGVKVRGEWYPLLKMEWVEGFTLNDFVAENLGKPQYLHALVQMWAKLAGRLRDADLAHADLQHGNVLLVPGATPQKLGLKLIDYDGMWVPALSGTHSGEVGHPNYQHPLRLKERLYNGDVDRFPHLVIAAGLRAALVGGKPVWDRFDNGDNLLFKEADLRDPAKAEVFKALWDLNDPVLRTLVGHIALSAKEPLRKTPWLDDVLLAEGGPKLSIEQERAVCALLGVTAAAPTGTRAAAAPAAVEQEFNVFQFLDEDEGPKPAEAKASGRRVVPKRKPVKKKSSAAPLLIGAGIGAALLVVGGIAAAVVLNRGKKDPTTEVVQGKEKEPENGSNPGGEGVIPKKEPPAPPPPVVDFKDELRQALADTKWNWGDGILELKADGSTHHPTWNDRFQLTTRWEALDRRTVALIIDKGRKQNQLAVLEFAEDLGSFVGFDFGSTVRMPPRPRVGPPARLPAGGPPAGTKQDLQPRLAGSEWEWGGAIRLRLNPDGSAEITRPKFAGKWAARWEPVDRRTAVVHSQGKAYDRLAVLQFSEDLREMSGYDFANPTRFVGRKRLDAGGAPAPAAARPSPAPVEVAAVAGGRDYLFARQGDPALYLTVDGSARKAAVIGRAGSPIHTLAAARDGARAVTGAEDGEVRLWTLPGRRAVLGKRLAGYDAIGLFQDRFGIDYYDRAVVLRDNATGRDEVVAVGKPGPAVAARFAGLLGKNDKLARDLGAPLTDEVKLFDGAVLVQAFEGGAIAHNSAANKNWWSWHGNRKPDDAPAPPAPTEATSVALKEHAHPVVAGAVSPDGTRAVTVDHDRQLCEWDLHAAKLVRKFPVTPARSVAYLPGGKTVLLGTEDQSAEVWDLETKARTKELAGHKGGVTTVFVSPHNDLAWTAGVDGEVRAWSLPDLGPVGALPRLQPPVTGMAVSRTDTRVLAIAAGDGTIHLYEPKTGASYGIHPGKGAVRGLAFLPGRLTLVAGREPNPVVVQVQPPAGGMPPSPPPGGAVLTLKDEAAAGLPQPMGMGYGPDGKHYWLANRDTILVGDGLTGKELKTVRTGNFSAATLGPGTDLYVSAQPARFQLWDWQTGEMKREADLLALRVSAARQVWPLPGQKRLVVVTGNPTVLVWDVEQWKEAERFTPYPMEGVAQGAPYPDGNRFAAVVAGRDGPRVVVWDVAARKEVFRADPIESRSLYGLSVSPGGKWIVGVAHDNGGQVHVWDGKTGKLAHTIKGVRSGNFGGGYSPGGDHYVYCEYSGRRLHLNLADGTLADDTRGQKGAFAAAAFPPSNLMATADTDGKVRVWQFAIDTKPADAPAAVPDPKSPPPTPVAREGFLKDSPELSGPVVAAAVSTDGKKVFAATQKGVVHVLDAVTAEESAKLEVTKARLVHMALSAKHLSQVNGIAVPDRLYVLDEERRLNVWDAEKGVKIRDVALDRYGLPTISPGTRLVSGPLDTHLMVFDPNRSEGYSWVPGRWTTAAVPTALQKPPFQKETKAVAFSTDGSVGAAYAARRVVVWRVRGGKDIRTLDAPTYPTWVAVAADAGVVVAGESSGRMTAWKYDTGAEVMSVREPHGFRPYHAAATGTWLVTAGADQRLRVWDLRSGKEHVSWQMNRSPTGVAVSADGRTAVVWHEDGDKVSLWALPEVKEAKGKK